MTHGLQINAFLCLFLLAIAGSLDKSRQVTDRQVEWEINRRQQLHQEQVPTQQADDKSHTTSSHEECWVCAMAEEIACQATKGWNEQKEDKEEDEVGS